MNKEFLQFQLTMSRQIYTFLAESKEINICTTYESHYHIVSIGSGERDVFVKNYEESRNEDFACTFPLFPPHLHPHIARKSSTQ